MTRSASCIVCVSLAGVLAATFGATDARAQPTHDVVSAWASVFVAVPLGDRMEARADGILQRTDNVSWVGWELARVIIVRTLNDHLSVGGGYTWFRIGNGRDGHSVEHRAVQALDLRMAIRRDTLVISLRTRLEERRREQQPGSAFRLRQQTRLDLQLNTRGVRAVAWNEYFSSINGTQWSGRSGPSFMLNFVGVHVPATKRTAIEPGYLNQTIFVARRNPILHVAALFITAHL